MKQQSAQWRRLSVLFVSITILLAGSALFYLNYERQNRIYEKIFQLNEQLDALNDLGISLLKTSGSRSQFQMTGSVMHRRLYDSLSRATHEQLEAVGWLIQDSTASRLYGQLWQTMKERLQIYASQTTTPDPPLIKEDSALLQQAILLEQQFASFKAYLQHELDRTEATRDRSMGQNYMGIWLLTTGAIVLLVITVRHMRKSERLGYQRDQARRISEAVQESEALFSSAFEFAPIGKALVNISGQWIRVNQSLCKMLGYTETELQALSFQQITHPDDLQADLNLVALLLAGEIDHYQMEKRYRHQQGHWVWASLNVSLVKSADGEPRYFIAQIEDITERKWAREELESQRNRLSNVIKGTNAGTWEWNVQTGKTVFNERWAELIGYRLAELEPVDINTWLRFVHPDDLRQSEERLEKCFSRQAEYYECECRMRHRNGHWVWVLDKGKVMSWTPDGQPEWMYGTHTDITALKEAIALLNSKNEELENFASIAAHDLKEPLRTMATFTQMLKTKYADSLDEKGIRYIELSVDAGNRMTRLINDLLDYARLGKEAVASEEVDMNDLVSEIVALHSGELEEKQAKVTWQGLPQVVGQKIPLRLLLQNLISNALKYQPAGGRPLVQLKGTEEPDHWLFAISDNGIGIEEVYFEKIFMLFTRLHGRNEYSGTGLGLATCKRVVEQHGGRIWVTSQPGAGSTFHFTLMKNVIR